MYSRRLKVHSSLMDFEAAPQHMIVSSSICKRACWLANTALETAFSSEVVSRVMRINIEETLEIPSRQAYIQMKYMHQLTSGPPTRVSLQCKTVRQRQKRSAVILHMPCMVRRNGLHSQG